MPDHIRIDERLTETISQAVTETLQGMFGHQVRLDRVVFGQKATLFKSQVSGVLTMIQDDALEANMIISFAQDALTSVLTPIYGEVDSHNSDVMRDAVSEISNMVYGIVKRLLNAGGYHFRMTMPTVVFGTDHILGYVSSGPSVTIYFWVGDKQMMVSVSQHIAEPNIG